jgi:parallel beta-helix repeat protein
MFDSIHNCFKVGKLRRNASILILALLFLSMPTIAFNVQTVRAQPAIYIMPDGSISSYVPANITTSDNVTYTFTGDNYLPIIVNRSNIIINGMGHTLQDPFSENGFSLSDVSNVTIKNTTITCYGNGISLDSSNYNSINGNNITRNGGNGIRLYYSSNNSISGNKFIDDGLCVWFSYHNSVENNTVNGKPLVYLEDTTNYTVHDAGQVILVRCGSIKVENLNLSRTTVGIQLDKTNNSIISWNNITNNKHEIVGVSVGIYLYSTSNNSIFGNKITNSTCGIYLESASNNSIDANGLTNNSDGILGVYASNNTISRNRIASNSFGITLGTAPNNRIIENNITNNDKGISLYRSSDNVLFHNNLINNSQQASSSYSTNIWSGDSQIFGGNYWSDYTGVDLLNRNGIGDTSYVIDAENIDSYPLFGPFRAFNVGNWNGRTYYLDIVSNSTISNFNFNATAKILSFNVTGTNGTDGFCKINMPTTLMSSMELGDWNVTVDNWLYSTYCGDANYTYFYLLYKHVMEPGLIHIRSTSAIPEFQPFILLPLLMTMTLFTAIILKKKHNTGTVTINSQK